MYNQVLHPQASWADTWQISFWSYLGTSTVNGPPFFSGSMAGLDLVSELEPELQTCHSGNESFETPIDLRHQALSADVEVVGMKESPLLTGFDYL